MASSMEMAGGGMPPTMSQNSPPVASGASPQGASMESLVPALKELLQASMDQNGFVDLNKFVQLWPQIAQKYGMNIPIDALMQMISQNPDMMDPIIQELGIAGIIKDGKQITGDELQAQVGGGAAGMAGGAMPPQGEV